MNTSNAWEITEAMSTKKQRETIHKLIRFLTKTEATALIASLLARKGTEVGVLVEQERMLDRICHNGIYQLEIKECGND